MEIVSSEELNKDETIKNAIKNFVKQNLFFNNQNQNFVLIAFLINLMYNQNKPLNGNEWEIIDAINSSTPNDPISFIWSYETEKDTDLILAKVNQNLNVTFDEIKNDITNLVETYKSLIKNKSNTISSSLVNKFLMADAECSEDSTVHFLCLYPYNEISVQDLSQLNLWFNQKYKNNDYTLEIESANDISYQIQNANNDRAFVSYGEIKIYSDRILKHDDNAIIVSISAQSLKDLYLANKNFILDANVRYYISDKKIDKDIIETMNDDPDNFWYLNNGITIACTNFDIAANKVVRLFNFSIVNGGQTSYLISYKWNGLKNFYIPCKIVKAIGNNDDDKTNFLLNIAISTNSQKPIRKTSLYANNPEQIKFKESLNNLGVDYLLKLGATKDKNINKEVWQYADFIKCAKLMVIGFFQQAALGTHTNSKIVNVYYKMLFPNNNNTIQRHAIICRDLLFINYAYKKFLRQIKNNSNFTQTERRFAYHARTINVAFISLLSRIFNDSFNLDAFMRFLNNMDYPEKKVPKIFADNSEFKGIVNDKYYSKEDELIKNLNEIFTLITRIGTKLFLQKQELKPELTQVNFLYLPKSYYELLIFMLKNGYSFGSLVQKYQTIFYKN